MLKNKLFPFINQYIHTYLFGFTEDQLSIGISSGNISLENLTLRNDTLNKISNTKHCPLWLKYGHISSISITCHIMNFIGEKPLDITINSPSIILMPSYKLLLQDKDALPHHTPYTPFTSKVFILEKNNGNTPSIEEHVNALLSHIFTYIQSSNFAVNVTINNTHIIIEDDELLNHKGEFMFGVFIPRIDVQLVCEGNVKTNKFKCSDVQVYYNNTNIIQSKLFLMNISNIKEYYKLIDHSVIRSKIVSNIKESGKCFVNVVEKFNVEATFHVKHGNNVEQLFIRNEHCYDVFINIKCNCLIVNVIPIVKEHVDVLCDFITKFKLQKHLQKFRKKKVESIKDVIAYVTLINKLKVFNKVNPLRKQFNKYYSLILRDYDREKTVFIDLNDNNNSNNSNKTSSKGLNNVNLNVNVNVVCNGISIYIFDSTCKRKFAVVVGTMQNKIMINQKEIKVNSNIKSIQIKTNEMFTSNDKDVPKFQFKYGQHNNNTNNNNNSSNTHTNTNIPLQNTAKNFIASHQLKDNNFSFFQGGLKESSLLDESPLVQRSQAKLYQEQARYIRKMRILSTTLGCPVNPSLPFKSNNYNPNTPKSFKSELLNESLTKSLQLSTEQSRSTDRQKQLRNDSISKAIAMYNNQKNKMNASQHVTNHTVIVNNNTHNSNNLNLSTNNIFRNGISAINRNTPMNSVNITNNHLSSLHKTFSLVNPGWNSRNNNNNRSTYTVLKTKHTAVYKELYSLPLLDISGINNGDHILFEYTRQLNIKNTDVVNVTIHMIRVNFFREYVSTIMQVIGDYKVNAVTLNTNDKRNSSNNNNNSNNVRYVLTKLLSDNIKLQKHLFIMKQSLYNTLMCSNDKSNPSYNDYVLYLKNELAKYPFKERELSLFESNYLFSYYLSNSIEFNVTYTQFDFIFYQNVANVSNHVLSHFKFNKNDIKLYLALSYVYIKCFDNEIEVTDYEHIADVVIGLYEEFHYRFARIAKVVRPCIERIKKEQKESEERHKDKVTKDNKELSELSRSIVLDSTPTKYKINFINSRNRTMCQFSKTKNNTYESNSSFLVNQFVGNSKTYV